MTKLAFLFCLVSVPAFAHQPDLTHLPLGDGKISTAPKRAWIWACRVDPQAGGASVKGPWIHDDGTYDLTTKAIVSGDVRWPYKFDIKKEGEKRVFTANDLPNHPTGNYPIQSSDKAYAFDQNPSSIREQSMRVEIPADPVLAAQPSCAPGAVGFLLSGAVLFNALDAPGRDAVAHETQDKCQGHPQEAGVYHYHSLSSCVKDLPGKDGHSQLMGYALDGFGIFGRKGVGRETVTNADLDECHGHSHEIDWDGKRAKMYHYHATWEFPYTVGCMRGAVDRENVRIISGPRGGGRRPGEPNPGPEGMMRGPRGPHPDLGAVATKLGISEDKLREALGPPPPNLENAAAKLGISVERLRQALPPPPPR